MSRPRFRIGRVDDINLNLRIFLSECHQYRPIQCGLYSFIAATRCDRFLNYSGERLTFFVLSRSLINSGKIPSRDWVTDLTRMTETSATKQPAITSIK